MDGSATRSVAAIHAAVDALLDASWDRMSDDEVLDVWRGLESVTRRLSAVDHAVIGQVSGRRLDHRYGARSVVALAREVLHVGAGEAKARVQAAEAAGPRVGLTGEVLPPIFAKVAAAQRAGEIAPAHARVVVAAVETLPEAVAAEHGEWLEATLVEHAAELDPDRLKVLAGALTYQLDQDGQLHDAASRDRRRELRVNQRADGSGRVEGELTAEATERLLSIIDAFGRPRPAVGGGQDPRTPGQRRHDALHDALGVVLRSGQAPGAGGLTTTVILTVPAEQWAAGQGIVTTGHGASLPVEVAKRWVGGETRFIAAALDRMRRVIAYGTSQRLFTEGQRLALIARDKGCSFPNCDAPPQWCESHHVIDWADGGPTSVDNGTLLCGVHHREFVRMGWVGVMLDGIPHWIPPPWIDRDQAPRRNRMHDRADRSVVHPEDRLAPV